MSLDGLRAWIGLVERRLTMRTRVFLVLVAIAIGGAAVGIYLAVDAGQGSVSKDEVERVREELEAGQAGGGSDLTQLEAELDALRGEVAELRAGKGTGSGSSRGGNGGAGTRAPGTGGGAGAGSTAPGTGGGSDADQEQLRKALERAQEQAAE